MKENTKVIIGIIAIILLLLITGLGVTSLIVHKHQNISKQTTKVTNLTTGETVSESNINLNNYTSNITINKAGTYTLTGTLKYSVIIDTTGDVVLNLNNAKINATTSGGIIAKTASSLTINLLEGSINEVSDGGASSYDAAIYANSKLIIDGTGKLTVNGNQTDGEGIATETNDMIINNGIIVITSIDDGLNAGGDGGTITINNGTLYIDASGDGIDSNKEAIINGGTIFVMGSDAGGNAGIDTDLGYTINGGIVIALGSDMIELPKEESTQKVMCFTFKDYIAANALINLSSGSNEIITFKGTKKFKTLIISTNKLAKGTYSLYKDGTDEAALSYGIYQSNKYQNGTKIDSYKLSNNIGNYEG